MGKIVVIAEKPSVGRDIARVLNCRQKGDGYLMGERYIVTWAIGHLVTLMEPEDYDPKYKRWALKTLPIIPEQVMLKVIPRAYKQFQVVKKLVNRPDVTAIVCATDAGREGELIFRYIYILTGCKKPFKRLWISSMTDVAIKEGFANLKAGKEYENLYYSAKCRSEADWMVGMNATRAFTVKYRTLLSIGRVQTPTLAMLVERQQEIDAFQPRDYWEVEVGYNGYIKNEGEVEKEILNENEAKAKAFPGLWLNQELKETRTYYQEEAQAIAGKVEGKTGIVTEVKNDEKQEPPPLLYDLTQLQRDANRLYGFSAKETLNGAQNLYEKYKLITYPRTDSRHLSRDMIPQLKATLARLAVEPYRESAVYLLGLNKLPVTKRIVDDVKVSDHHAIIPTPVTPALGKLPEQERKIYHLVVSRFIAAFFPPYRYTSTTITVAVQEEQFVSKGKAVLDLGWKKVENHSQNKENAVTLPVLREGEEVTITAVQVAAKKTKPPAPYTEASLLGAMEHAGRFVDDEELKEQLKENGLGTPATRAAIIERLIEVGYVMRRKKTLIPTDKGMQLISIVPSQLKSPEMTGRWERGLAAIAKGDMQPVKFMESISKYVQFIVGEIVKEKPVVTFTKATKEPGKGASAKRTSSSTKINPGELLGNCPLCRQGQISVNKKGYGCSNWQSGCKFFMGKIAGKSLTPNQVKQLITTGETKVIKGFRAKNGGKFQAKLAIKEGKLAFIYDA